MKTLSRISYGSTSNSSSKKISTNNNNNKIWTNSHQKVFGNIPNKRPVLKSLLKKVPGLQSAALSIKRLQYKCFLVKLLRGLFLSNIFERLLLEEHKILLKMVPIIIPNDIWKAYYQKGFVIYFLRSTYRRFMEFLIETYDKGFSCSSISSASWALLNT